MAKSAFAATLIGNITTYTVGSGKLLIGIAKNMSSGAASLTVNGTAIALLAAAGEHKPLVANAGDVLACPGGTSIGISGLLYDVT